jgi:hypothetical protein
MKIWITGRYSGEVVTGQHATRNPGAYYRQTPQMDYIFAMMDSGYLFMFKRGRPQNETPEKPLHAGWGEFQPHTRPPGRDEVWHRVEGFQMVVSEQHPGENDLNCFPEGLDKKDSSSVPPSPLDAPSESD